jgi:hypothetical protein
MGTTDVLRLFVAMLSAATALAGAAPVSATPSPRPSLKQLIESSAAVIVATPTEVDARRPSLHKSGLPLTKVTFDVKEVIAGRVPAQSLTFEVPGGYVPGTNEIVSSTEVPVFEPNELYLLFLTGGDWAFSPVSHYTHGAFRVGGLPGNRHFVTMDGLAVVAVSADGFAIKARTEEPAHGRYRRDVLKDPVTIAEPSAAEKGRRSEAAREALSSESLLAGLRTLAKKETASQRVLSFSPDLAAPASESSRRKARETGVKVSEQVVAP